jgi:hypothetical protein
MNCEDGEKHNRICGEPEVLQQHREGECTPCRLGEDPKKPALSSKKPSSVHKAEKKPAAIKKPTKRALRIAANPKVQEMDVRLELHTRAAKKAEDNLKELLLMKDRKIKEWEYASLMYAKSHEEAMAKSQPVPYVSGSIWSAYRPLASPGLTPAQMIYANPSSERLSQVLWWKDEAERHHKLRDIDFEMKKAAEEQKKMEEKAAAAEKQAEKEWAIFKEMINFDVEKEWRIINNMMTEEQLEKADEEFEKF